MWQQFPFLTAQLSSQHSLQWLLPAVGSSYHQVPEQPESVAPVPQGWYSQISQRQNQHLRHYPDQDMDVDVYPDQDVDVRMDDWLLGCPLIPGSLTNLIRLASPWFWFYSTLGIVGDIPHCRGHSSQNCIPSSLHRFRTTYVP